MSQSSHTLSLPGGATLSYIGPNVSFGPMPALFYFAFSAKDSLHLDPYNQPVSFLSSFPMRIFSMDLPAHENGLSPLNALTIWAKELSQGRSSLEEFCASATAAIETLAERKILIPNQIGVAGLSRGAFIATHIAARTPLIRSILGFSPLTYLSKAKEFDQESGGVSLAEALDLPTLIDPLIGKHLRFYIGNRDTRVSTSRCFQFIEKLSDASFHKKIRSPQVELIIGPSIGQYGHGTSKKVFEAGALWMANELGISK